MEVNKATKNKNALLIVFLLSAGLDIISTGFGFSFSVPTIFGSMMMEEMVEWLISSLVVRYYLDDDLSTFEQVAGFIPIPGVTALSIKCAMELIKSRKKK